MHESIESQFARLSSVPYGCNDPEHYDLQIGTQESHWTMIGEFADLILENAGPAFPNGIFFEPAIGGLPVPTGDARKFFSAATDGIVARAKQTKVHVCDPTNHGGMKTFLKDGFDAGFDLLKPYLRENCVAIRKALASTTDFQRVSLIGTKAVIKDLPNANRLVNDFNMTTAIANVFVTTMFDTDGGRYVLV